ncbi:tetratricopeptide repeat protein [Phenylobacterium sp. J367]|uniref:tetratricopeptide repeat protein n=1 Tax=Phenylobacterium sp. J367 TaxID=2898435 RepID=UPI0021515E77|nr:tetratricopeptide repeat protein [Phenylobacterium sp. J367]MCR5879076.1 tetratricopeptide repeat protein [Phenylobacterium sp. J367]
MSLRRALRTGVAAVCIAGVIAPAGAAAPGSGENFATRGPLDVRVAQAEAFSRVEFHWSGRTSVVTRRDGRKLILTFSRDADPDIARLRNAPPKWLAGAEKRHVGGRLEVTLLLTDDAEAKVGSADGATYVNVFERPAPPPSQVAEAGAAAPAPVEPEPPRPNPLPPGGVVPMQAKVVNSQVLLTFDWANPAGAAVFRRGGSIWVVFDAPAKLDVSKAPLGVPQFSGIETFRGADYAAIRIDAARDIPVAAVSQGAAWTISLGPGDQPAPTVVKVSRDAVDGPAILQAAVAGATRVIRLPDPGAGDELTVVTALGPAKGVPARRDFIQMAFLPSVQGLAIEPRVEDLNIVREGDLVSIGRDRGLTLSPAWAIQARESELLGAPRRAAMPAMIDPEWAATGEHGFLRRYNSLLDAAAAETASTDKASPVAAQLALARFLVGSELSFEAIGVLNAALKHHPELADNAEFRGLRGMARVMARRYREAELDFSAPVLAEDPSASLWRSYIAAQRAHWPEARAEFSKGLEAFSQFSPVWKARFARGDAQAALALGDLTGADARIKLALADKAGSLEELETRLVQARVFELQGDKDRALRVYQAVSRAPLEKIASPALLRATQIQVEMGKITPIQAANTFDGLRYRWRGDATELETIRALGQLYLSQGRYREALDALRSAGMRLPDLPEAIQLQNDLTGAFRGLFLDGLADGLEPIQALALFYDFKELTPIGADGDLMVRKLVRRLVDVDLLSQAADLLKYQADNRLEGVAKAQVATDLALIYLMDRKPEQALQAINSSRTTVLPTALNLERRLIEARAWTGVGRYDGALEIIERDNSREAQELRAEITWKQKNWGAAGPLFEKSLGDRWKRPEALSSDEEGRLLRAGVAYSLAGDEVSLARLESQYRGFYDQAHNPEALRVALTGVPTGRVSAADFGRVTADNEVFAGWVGRMKERFRTRPSPTSPAKAAAPAKQAPTNVARGQAAD